APAPAAASPAVDVTPPPDAPARVAPTTPAAPAVVATATPAPRPPAIAATAPAAPASQTAAPAAVIDARYGPLANAALAAQAAWMATAADEIWFIQLHTNTNIDAGSLEKQIETAHQALPDTPIRVYAAQLGSNARTGVILGRYETEIEALNALRALPARYRDGGAYVRQARRLR
ncbi:MAG: hypothetical protein KDE64_13040, partial [Rhodocyclaceae bacterium]|nr:hypothetical protein [Rhodocyclaceae bacterium]